MSSDHNMQCDYLVVGGGSAGAVLARRLADANIGSVILVEAGKSDEDDPAILDLSRLDDQGPETEWGFLASPIEGSPQQIKYLRAKMLGGCGGHNDCAFLVPPDSDFDRWESQGAKGWSASAVASYFRRIESIVPVDTVPPVSPVSKVFLRAGNEMGLPQVDFREQITPGVGVFPLNLSGSKRQSSSVCYLHPLDQFRPDLRVICDTRIHKLITENSRVTGCLSDQGKIKVKREVLLTCGSIQTPQLMMISGIGPGKHLQEYGIDVIADLPVGQHLIDHAAANVVADLAAPIPPWQLTPCEVSMLLQVDDDQPAPDLLYHFVLRMRDKYEGSVEKASPVNGVKIAPNVARPKSEGCLKLRSIDIRDQPEINLNYFSDPQDYDMQTLIKGIRFARRLLETRAFQEVGAKEVWPGVGIDSDNELAGYIRQTCETVYHPAGTCRMGEIENNRTVVGPDLRVKGMENLRVCDASVFPSMVTVNINNTVMMVAEKAADMIIGSCARE